MIFLFLRNIPATIIPSLAVPLSLVGALAIMYQLGFSLDNLSLMALTDRHRLRRRRRDRRHREYRALPRGRRQSERGGAQGLAADRLHHHLADGVAARGADPAAVHGRRGRPPVPRIRHHARRDDRHLGGGVADAGADDVRQAAARRTRRARSGRHHATGGRFFQALLAWYGRALDVVLDHQPTTLLVALATFVLTGYLYVDDPQGVLPAPGHRHHPGRHPGGCRTCPSTRWPIASSSSPTLILRDPDVDSLSSFIGVDGSNVTLNSGRFLINLKPHDQRTADRRPRSSAACSTRPPTSPASRSTCSRCRICRSTPQVSATAISVHARQPGSRHAAELDAEGARAPRQGRRDRRRRQRPAAERPRGDWRRSTGRARRASASPRRRSTTRSTTPTASASSRPSSPSRTSIASFSTSTRR